VCLRAVLDVVVKRKIPNPRQESNPRTPIIQPTVQHYTEYLHINIGFGNQWLQEYVIIYADVLLIELQICECGFNTHLCSSDLRDQE